MPQLLVSVKKSQFCTFDSHNLLKLHASYHLNAYSPDLWGASGPQVLSPHGADVFPTPRPVGWHAWGIAPPTPVRAIPPRRPAHNRSSQTHSPRPQAPRDHGHWCVLSVLTRPPRLASPPR